PAWGSGVVGGQVPICGPRASLPAWVGWWGFVPWIERSGKWFRALPTPFVPPDDDGPARAPALPG
ncbi:MAG: hypothetical protein EBQ56_04495, partial [Proteobacteria bacterium]|nr:hypothetical protein [Pseudomonadota bacterium]